MFKKLQKLEDALVEQMLTIASTPSRAARITWSTRAAMAIKAIGKVVFSLSGIHKIVLRHL